jgi:hypothetical protein
MLIRLHKVLLICFIDAVLYILMTNQVKAATVEEEIREFLEAYFHAQYQCLSNLKEKDMKEFYYIESLEGEKAYSIDKEALSFIIECRSIQENDLKLKNYQFNLSYKVNEIHIDNANVVLIENSKFHFQFLKGIVSQKYNVEHKFKMKRTETGWKICGHESNEDEFKVISDGIGEFRSYESVKEFYLDIMRKNKETQKKDIRYRKDDENELKKAKKEAHQSNRQKANYLNYYHREKAVIYAKQWSENGARLRNSPTWGNYDPPVGNGDCTNFISQCIYSGGIPMDYTGMEFEQWKWYGDIYNSAQVAKGRVASWTGVQGFYNYCKFNKGFGMSAFVDSSWNKVQIGDVVQLGKSEDNFFHSVIVTEYAYDDKDTLKDFLICSHTTDRYNYPLSAYSYPLKRYIHINGWSN